MPAHPLPPGSESPSTPSRQLARLVGLVDGTISRVRLLAGLSLISAAWLWWWLLGSITLRGGWGAGVGGAGLLALVTPSVVLGVTAWGLQQVRRIPERAVDSVQERKARADAAWQTARAETTSRTRAAWNVFRALREIWTLVSDSRDTLLGYAALARLANPISLAIILTALVCAVGLTAAAAISAPVVLLLE